MSEHEVARLGRDQYAAIAAFRFELRRFLAFSEAAASAEGVPAQQHQALLAIAGHLGAQPPTVGVIAEHLLVAPHTAAELVTRMEKAGLVSKAPGQHDGRRVELRLTARAEGLLARLTAAHVKELTELEPALSRALERLGQRLKGGAGG